MIGHLYGEIWEGVMQTESWEGGLTIPLLTFVVSSICGTMYIIMLSSIMFKNTHSMQIMGMPLVVQFLRLEQWTWSNESCVNKV